MSTSGGSGGGGGNSIPIAQLTGATIVQMDDPLNPGTMINVVSLPLGGGEGVTGMAFCLDGDTAPRSIFFPAGFAYGNGTDSPASVGALILYEPGAVFGFQMTDPGAEISFSGQAAIQFSSTAGIAVNAPDIGLTGETSISGDVQVSGQVLTTAGFAAIESGSGSDAQGVATLVGGTVDVPTTLVAADSRIQLTPQDTDTTGVVVVSAVVPGDHFTITSTEAGDTGAIAWELFLGPSQIT